MAITHRGFGEASALNGGDPTITLPGGTADGDTVYFSIASWSSSIGMITSGYTLVDAHSNSNLDNIAIEVHRKRMSSTPDSTAQGDGDGNSLNGIACVCQVLIGVDATTPEDATPTRSQGRSSNPNPASITTVTNGAWVLPCSASAINDTAITAPSGYSNKVDINANDTQDTTLGMATKEVATAGSEDPASWTSWSSGTWASITVAVRPATGGGNYTLTAAGGSYTLTGTAASLLVKKKLDATSAGSYALTGTAATLRKAYPLTAGGGSYAISGTAAALTHNKILTAAAGSYALTGTAAALSKGLTLAAASGGYSIGGVDASLLKTWLLQAASGTYTLSGTDASVLRATALSAGAGAYTMSGTAVTLVRGLGVTAASGSYVLTGTAATLIRDLVAAAGSGSYALSGTAASLLHDYMLAAGAGGYVITGADAALALLSAKVIGANAGSYALSGSSASVLWDKILSSAGGGYLLNGTDVTLTYTPGGVVAEFTLGGRSVTALFTRTGISLPDPEDMTRQTDD